MNKSRLSALAACAALALSACGGGGGAGSATEDALVAALEKSQMDSGDELGQIGIGEPEYRCMAKGVLSNKEYATAIEAGIEAGKTGDELLDTIDEDGSGEPDSEVMSLLLECLGEEKLVELLVISFGSDPSVTDEMKTCLREGLTDMGKDRLIEAFQAITAQDQSSEAFAELTEVFTGCVGG